MRASPSIPFPTVGSKGSTGNIAPGEVKRLEYFGKHLLQWSFGPQTKEFTPSRADREICQTGDKQGSTAGGRASLPVAYPFPLRYAQHGATLWAEREGGILSQPRVPDTDRTRTARPLCSTIPVSGSTPSWSLVSSLTLSCGQPWGTQTVP